MREPVARAFSVTGEQYFTIFAILLNLQLIEDMLHKVEQKIRQGDWHAVRLDRMELELIEKSGDYALCKEGEIYLVEVSNIDRRVN